MNTNGGDCLGYFLPATDDQAGCGAVEQSLAGTSLMMIVNQAGG